MRTVLREEKKFLINIEDAVRLEHKLDQIMIQDGHNDVHGYPIRSLYFDTIYDQDYYEKAAGTELRRKMRLRIYDPSSDFAMLEMKQKQGAMQRKRSLRLSREDAETVSRGIYTPLLSYKDDFAAECFGLLSTRCYRPVTVVEYRRKAYIAKENRIRITFDSRIESTESGLRLFDPGLNMNPVLDPFDVVLEVKYNGFLLDYIRSLINETNRSELSVSKYMLARHNAYRTHI